VTDQTSPGSIRRTALGVSRLLLLSPVVCTLIGCMFGGVYIAAHALASGGVSLRNVVHGFPIAVLTSSVVTGPFSVFGGLCGALLAIALGQDVLRLAPRRRWLRVGAATGTVPGLLIAMFFMMKGADFVFGLVAVLACITSGVFVAWLGWREFGRANANG
jgi:MFS-type transporter involved in bile tolerance (Atg22 family)